MLEDPINRFTHTIDDENVIDLIIKTNDAILSLIPHCTTSTKWKVPFYTYHKNLSYINRTKDFIYIGYMQGQLMNDHELLDKSGTTTIAKYYIHNENDLRENGFFEILLDAVALQDRMFRKK